MPLTLFLDILIVALLLVSIIYAIVVDNHLSATKENYRMLSRLIEQFYQAANKTQDELLKLKNEQEKAQQDLLKETNNALKVKGELESLLDKIERKTLVLNTNNMRFVSSDRSNDEIGQGVTGRTLSQSEKELLVALNEIK